VNNQILIPSSWAGKKQIVRIPVGGLPGNGFTSIGGVFTQVDVPGATATLVDRINNKKNVVGTIQDSCTDPTVSSATSDGTSVEWFVSAPQGSHHAYVTLVAEIYSTKTGAEHSLPSVLPSGFIATSMNNEVIENLTLEEV
jgi:hypothetical protein